MPGMYCPVRVIRNNGKATLSSALTENSGVVQTGAARLNSTRSKLTWPITSSSAMPISSTPTMA
ncbi:hypothetical protein D3C81_2305400 [compost metagenome]